MIRLEDVRHAYDERPVLRGITAELTERRIGIIGANGSGKSTLARTFNGLVIPDSGTVETLGLDVRRKRSEVRRKVGFMFADASAQIVMPTPAEDVALSLRPPGRGRRRPVDTERVAQVLAEFGLADHADAPAQLLSSGQKQMLAFASVLVTEPEILVCDEPTTLLDLRNVLKVRDRLAALEQQVVLLTHHLELLDDFDRVLVMDDGALVHDGPPAESIAFYRALAAR
ncbi:cobalt ABC transporter ATP-binding protein [Tsukamurella pulmonis]|uniref:Biotin transport system ATP-binding protein n=1 Tax=Tsukamurella pulmonis TaxID=47312 RepID=A0A1H1AVY5_9ACTN|nr:ABC transporter ATP-binding protein [Tsukamurella pulmonis]KXO92841.1 cobalt ABC transporter ATP-binding protein [Tsukamurella pulmonis]RDH10950.1 ABC transporter ATP-binding protein [Tsukamurella pulmonis]SDQ43829.1 biotin transport system ATP-binding protein [Tsukamurella pulmonis]SUP26027.1 Biotin transport ATP-binding protein BioM [Tsukamurella pulmonis]BDD84743.1 cobalt ABC transporter ATP-binding protein [Tsukamurella pulmonis]